MSPSKRDPKSPPPQAAAADASAQRARRGAARRQAILDAALEEFSLKGFAGTRLDDVARRAGIAKGTVYLYFDNKETLFQELLRGMFAPIVATLEHTPADGRPVRETVEAMADMFVTEVIGTRRKDVIRLVIAEGVRFPKLAEFYYREVVSRAMAAIAPMMKRAHQRGEIHSDAYARFPQLLVAPALLAVIWGVLFERFSPLEARALMRAHVDLIFGGRKAP